MSRTTLVTALFVVLIAGLWLSPASHRFLVTHAENNLGALYWSGVFGEAQRARALDWYRRAAALGSGAAALNLGYALQNGVGTAADEAEAMRSYAQAADAGFALAANNLAMLHANPSHGRPRLALARHWLLRARALDDGSLRKTIDANLAAMEHDMTPPQLAASEDPARAARFDAPPPPRSTTPMSADDVHHQVTRALAAAATLHAAADGYIHAHHQLPTPGAVAQDARFDPLDTPGAHVALGPGAMVQITLRGGPYDGEDIGWIPLVRGTQLTWICTHGRVPLRYFDASCR